MALSLYFCVITLSLMFGAKDILADSIHEDRLLHDLFEAYNKMARPGTLDDKDKVSVGMSFNVVRLLNLMDDNLSVNGWLTMKWRDYRLQWNPSSYGGVTTLNIPIEILWTPDITLYTGPITNYIKQLLAVVKSDGMVMFIPSIELSTYCSAADNDGVQTCPLKFGSWTYEGRKLDIYKENAGISLSNVIPNRKISLMNATAVRHEAYYDCCPNMPYLDITFTLAIKANPSK